MEEYGEKMFGGGEFIDDIPEEKESYSNYEALVQYKRSIGQDQMISCQSEYLTRSA